MDKNEIEIEISKFRQWFDVDYARKEQKYNRLIALGKLTDKGTDPQEERLKLYEIAEITRKKIKELEKML